MQFMLSTDGTVLGDIHAPQGNPPPTWTEPGFQNLAVLPSTGDGVGKVEDLYETAGTNEIYTPWEFDGRWDAQSHCVSQFPPTPANPNPGWTSPCRINGSGTWPGCLVQVPVTVAGPAGGVAPALLGENLPAFVQGRFSGGVVSSLPRAPAPGLTNIFTCFYVSDMTVDGQPADPNRDSWWEKVVVGPDDVADGRHIVYVFRVHVHYEQTVWDFGDGTSVVIPQGGSSPEPPPAQCGDVPDQQFIVAHRYSRYSTGDGLPHHGSAPVQGGRHGGLAGLERPRPRRLPGRRPARRRARRPSALLRDADRAGGGRADRRLNPHPPEVSHDSSSSPFGISASSSSAE